MDKIVLYVGSRRTTSSGMPVDHMRPVEFEGKELANQTTFHGSSDTRGITETLYKTGDGRFVVYIEDWTKWQGETSRYRLKEVTRQDLDVGGDFEQLGRAAGFGRSLTLDEALEDDTLSGFIED